MSEHIDPLDRAFDSLKSHGAVLSDSFSHRLEDRLMQEQQKRTTGRAGRRALWVAIAILALLGGGVASYAATDGFNLWPWSVSIDDDGIVTNEDGNVIGFTVDNDDGSSTSYIQMGEGHIEVTPVEPGESLKGKSINVVVEP
jgi:hypothetical protein